MGEFHEAVTRLLGLFSCGISMIKAQRRTNDVKPDPTNKKASVETQLSKSLKKNRLELETAYGEDLLRYGSRFADGDAEAQSSLSQILQRLNAVIKRFTSGKTISTDYQVLMNLSKASRIEAINTFGQLSQRLSQSSLAAVRLVSSPETRQPHRHQKRKKTPGSKHARSKSRSELSITPAGLARPKSGSKPPIKSIAASKGSSSSAKQRGPKNSEVSSSHSPALSSQQSSRPSQRQILATAHIEEKLESVLLSQHTISPIDSLQNGTENRKSFMSFASDSTKIGEIPNHKWAATQANDYHRTIYYPIEPYQQPGKQRSRFMKLFRR